jgi:hypothetical protein
LVTSLRQYQQQDWEIVKMTDENKSDEQMVHVQLTKETRDALAILKNLWNKPRMADVLIELLERHHSDVLKLVRTQQQLLDDMKKPE